ncbi:ABC transporter permease [Candidatus Eisenbacteria bacterium]|uniref:ABC transporter permease n=1 Tax=Eiseniibacteriota bacterium TaxID=2212470 RepID=A0ABV6YP48_UNCEI
MTRFLLKGLLRDRNRSLFPVIIVMLGVMVSVLMYCFMLGVMDDMIRSNAKLDTGHVKVMTRAYEEIAQQLPNDLALAGVDGIISDLERGYSGMEWVPRIRFAGLLDIPDENGETRSQGPVMGIAADLLGQGSKEVQRLNLETAVVRGRLPEKPDEILISEEFALSLDVEIGDLATLISATSTGSMALQNFRLVGTIKFGVGALDRNMMIADIHDVQYALDMDNGASELLGFFPNLIYDEVEAERVMESFNAGVEDPEDDFAPVMLTLSGQHGLGEYLDMMNLRILIILGSFFFVMSMVLWNAGLMSGIRRFGEIGVRLAIGESKMHVYTSLLVESLLVGIAGSAIGTALGLGISYYLQEVGWDISGMMEGTNMIMADVMRARVTPASYYIGFVPGLLATFLGSAISGIAVFRRRTAQLFKELET